MRTLRLGGLRQQQTGTPTEQQLIDFAFNKVLPGVSRFCVFGFWEPPAFCGAKRLPGCQLIVKTEITPCLVLAD